MLLSLLTGGEALFASRVEEQIQVFCSLSLSLSLSPSHFLSLSLALCLSFSHPLCLSFSWFISLFSLAPSLPLFPLFERKGSVPLSLGGLFDILGLLCGPLRLTVGRPAADHCYRSAGP